MKKLFPIIIIFGICFKLYATSKSRNLIEVTEQKYKKHQTENKNESRKDSENVKYSKIEDLKSKTTNGSLDDRTNLSKQQRVKSEEFTKSSQKNIKHVHENNLDSSRKPENYKNAFVPSSSQHQKENKTMKNIENFNAALFDKATMRIQKPMRENPEFSLGNARTSSFKIYPLPNGQSRDSKQPIRNDRNNLTQSNVAQSINQPNKSTQSDYRVKNYKMKETATEKIKNLSDSVIIDDKIIPKNNTPSAELNPDHLEWYPDYISVGFELYRRNSRYLKQITVLDSRGIKIYDTLIYPRGKRQDFSAEVHLTSRNTGLKINQFLDVRSKISQLIEGKVLVGYKLPTFLRNMKLSHYAWMIRDVYTLIKYTDIFLIENRNRKLSYFEYLYLDASNTSRSIGSLDKAETSARLYRKFRSNWEIEINILAKRPGTQLNQVIHGTYEELPIPNGVRYIGFHCDTANYLPTYQKLPVDIVALNVDGFIDSKYKKFQWRRASLVGHNGCKYYDTLIYPTDSQPSSDQPSGHQKTLGQVREDLNEVLSKTTIMVGFGILKILNPIIRVIRPDARIYDLETYGKEFEFKVDNIYEMARHCLHTDFIKELPHHESEGLLKAKIALQIFSLYRFDTNNLINPFVIARHSLPSLYSKLFSKLPPRLRRESTKLPS